ncbi:uncharacterized protein J4E84_010574 [Alternaria hordeiaustralica]|uniref:uncharacterized protein n=1 Tax=Alternaria hordeiaustralica TaxID=1187925 RepID=UPI0020C49CBB|nr:uncharacterized protein J4E84_010574 [Alternaria hordeiaustralica]KAI4674336.1 hypothetical protein J4E84_010574 [Alternaria hordeiaustralica]
MAGPTVYTDVAEDFDFASGGQLFAGKKFWVAQRVASRKRLLDDIKANGGEIVALEKKADYLIVDHARRDCPPGSTSYEFIEKSIKEGELQDPEDYTAGPPSGEAREAGSIHQPTKSGRTAYTAEEDRTLSKWVRDAQSKGASVSGNELYKQLEAKYPRHTWQSWRDRWVKTLSKRPLSAFTIPDNAPPSPPSDQSNERMPPVPAPSKPTEQQTPKTEQAPSATNLDNKGKAKANRDYSVEELEVMFSTDDWLECYAFVPIIDGVEGQDDWISAWDGWAENQGNQTAEQWRQYYEKVVRPQWLRDPVSKRDKIRKKMEQKHDAANARRSQALSQHPAEIEKPDEILSQPSPTTRNRVEPVQRSASEGANSEELPQPRNPPKIASEPKMPSSSTARQESPNFYDEQLARYTKRLREDNFVKQEDEEELAPPTKRRKSGSATPIQEEPMQPIKAEGTQNQPVEISSAASSQTNSTSEDAEELMQEQILSQEPDALDEDAAIVNIDEDLKEEEVRSIESDDFPDIDELHPLSPPREQDSVSGDDLPSNTSTPRATRQKISNFDTQAILSSPTQDGFSRPQDFVPNMAPRQPQRFSSPPEQPASDASTTQSMEEFRRSLQEEGEEEDPDQTLYSQHPPQPLVISSSPAPSTSSTGEEDPDPPLTGDEIVDFYTELNEQKWSDEFISSALKRTGLRPDLAEKVLDAWKVGKPLPMERGIWSKEDDDAVEGGDGYQLALLEKKHTLDGWGGIVERLKFLDTYRSR